MGNLYVTGSIAITASGRDVTTQYGALWPSFGHVADLFAVRVPETEYAPFVQPPDSGPPLQVTGSYLELLGEGSLDDGSWGLKAQVTASGIVSATSAALLNPQGLVGVPFPTWRVIFNPYPGADLLPTWASKYNTTSIGAPDGNFYPQPVFTVFTSDVGDWTDPAWVPPVFLIVPPGNHIALMTGQTAPRAYQNGLWVVAHSLGVWTFTRPGDWSTWLSNWTNASGVPNSVVFIYAYIDGTTAPFTVGYQGPSPDVVPDVLGSGGMWVLRTADGATWLSVWDSLHTNPQYRTGYQVLANDGVSYEWNGTYTALGVNPVDSASVIPGYQTFFPTTPHTLPWPWVATGYQSDDTQKVDCGAIDIAYVMKMALTLSAPTIISGYTVDLYACAGADNSGYHVGSFTPQVPTGRFTPPSSGYVDFDYYLGGSGTQDWYDGNPVQFGFRLPPNDFKIAFGSNISGVLAAGASAAAIQAALDAILSDTLTLNLLGGGTSVILGPDIGGTFTGYIMGAAGRNLGSIACQGFSFQTIDQVTGFTTNYPLSGTSSAWYGNIYIVPRGTGQTAAQVAALYTSGGTTATATEAGPNAFQVILSNGTDPNPRLPGLTPRSPWRVVVTFPDGSIGDSYSPGPLVTVTPHGSAGIINGFVTGNLTTPPPSSGEYKFWLDVAITGNLGPVNPSVPASGASIANDVYHRPVIAIDTGSGTAIAVNHDAGLTWTTHVGPSGSLPSLCIDQRSNMFILTVNSGTVATTYRNPNSDWASTTGMTTGATVSGAAGAIYGEPNNQRHLFMAVVVSGSLDVYESFDGADNWALRSTVTTGMATNRGLCASIQWVGSALFIIYSKGTSLFAQRSVDGGSTWQSAVTIATGHTYSFVTAVVQGGQIIVRGVDDTGSAAPWHHWQSSNLAATWTDVTNAATPQTNVSKPSAIGRWDFSGKLIISGSNLT